MPANPTGVNGPRMGVSHGRLRNTMLNSLSKMSGQRQAYPTTVVARPAPAQQGLNLPGQPAPQAAPFQVQAPAFSRRSLDTPTVPLLNATPMLDLSSGTAALNQSAQNLAVLAQLAGKKGPGGGTPGSPAGNGQPVPAGSRPPTPTGLDNVGANMRLARWMAAQRGWGPDQFKFIDFIVSGHGSTPAESNWLGSAHNPAGAFGIGQRYTPAHPWLSAAEKQHYLTSVQYQIAWMYDYIASRYQTPAQAWAYKLAHHNY